MSQILKYAKFNYWANELLLLLIESEINDEQLDRVIQSSFPSLRETVYHIWGAEFIWLQRLQGNSQPEWPSKNFAGKFSEAKQKMLLNDQAFIDYVGSLSDEIISSDFTYKNIEGKTFTNSVYDSIHHCMNHSTYHRGQVVTMLRQLGVKKIPSTDFISFVRLQ